MTTIRHQRDYGKAREIEYPSLSQGDLADLLLKTIVAVREGAPLPADVLAWAAQCEEVKARFPKPVEQKRSKIAPNNRDNL